ncbi:MAG: hypothetical protein WC833_00865 [Bacteroidales bacterium]|jgi:hypothetical protein
MKTQKLSVYLLIGVITFFAGMNKGLAAQTASPKYTAADLVYRAFNRVSRNYPRTDNQMNAFYKEQVVKNNAIVSVNEVMLNIGKGPYLTTKKDIVSIQKIRGNQKNLDQELLMIKLQGGPITALQLDVVKNPFLGGEIFNLSDFYDFEYEEPAEINQKNFYVVKFKEKAGISEMLFRGKIYIETESLAIGKVEFSMNVENRDYAYERFLKHAPKQCKIRMISATYSVNYKEYGNLWYFDYSSSDVSFILNHKENLPQYYTVCSEMAITNLVAEGVTIDKKDQFKETDILLDKINDVKMASDWDIYNKILLLAAKY